MTSLQKRLVAMLLISAILIAFNVLLVVGGATPFAQWVGAFTLHSR